MAADNSLNRPDASPYSNFATEDLEEIKQGYAQATTDNVHLLVYIDIQQAGIPARLVELKKSPDGNVVEHVVRTYTDRRNSVGVDETAEVFSDVFRSPAYQAHHYGLIYCSHGEGWMPYPARSSSRWIGQDNGDGDHRMNIEDLVRSMEGLPRLDFILFDACFMGAVEVAYDLRHCADYVIASPTEIPGPGAKYDKLVPALFSATSIAHIAAAYYEPYATMFDYGNRLSNANWTAGVSVAVIRTADLENLAATTARLLARTTIAPSSSHLRRALFDYDKRIGNLERHIGYYDLANLMRQLLSPADYPVWELAFTAARPYWQTTSMNYSVYGGLFSTTGANGLSCYVPLGNATTADNLYRLCHWYQAAGLSRLGW
ncbi:MAG: peptidase C11 [Prevotellaceae bacterium]|nr:peptidase C11 [Prevotellaceae bacterium]